MNSQFDGTYVEYVIWGYPPDSDIHSLLQTQYNFAPITDKQTAYECARTLREHYECTNVTVQVLDGTLPFQ